MWRATRAMLSAMFVAVMLFGIASNAQAADAPASLTMQSAPGDFLGQGNDYGYSRPQDQIWANLGYNQSVIYGTVNGLNGDHWTVEFAAPDGQPLQAGNYTSAQGAPFQQPGYPGIQVNNGVTCQTISGQFDVRDIEETNGVPTRLDVTFEEYCNGAAVGLTGESFMLPRDRLKMEHFGYSEYAFPCRSYQGKRIRVRRGRLHRNRSDQPNGE